MDTACVVLRQHVGAILGGPGVIVMIEYVPLVKLGEMPLPKSRAQQLPMAMQNVRMLDNVTGTLVYVNANLGLGVKLVIGQCVQRGVMAMAHAKHLQNLMQHIQHPIGMPSKWLAASVMVVTMELIAVNDIVRLELTLL